MKFLKSPILSFNSLNLLLVGSAFLGVSFSYGNFYLYHFFMLLSSTFWIYSFKQNDFLINLDILKIKYVPTLLIVFFWYVLSTSWTLRVDLGIKYVFYVFCGLFVTLSIIFFSKTIENFNKITYLLGTLICFEITIALLESFSSFRMPISSYSSFASIFAKDQVNFSDFGSILAYSNFQPPTGFRWNTNDLAICMVISLPFFLCSKRFAIQLLGIISISTIIIMTSSRAVFLALILVYSLYLIFIKKRLGTLIFIWFVSALFIYGIFQFKDSENPRINELANSAQALTLYLSGQIDVGGSLEWRRELVENGLKAFYDSNFIGLGAGGSVANQELIGAVAQRFTSMHNFWIELLVEGGIIIAILILFFLVGLLYDLFLISLSSENPLLKYYSQSLFLSLSAFIPAAIAASSTIYFFPMWILFGSSISVIFLSKSNIRYETLDSPNDEE